METKKIGSFEISQADVDAFIARLPQEQQMYAQMPEFVKQCEERVEEITLFAAFGEDTGIEETEEYKAAMAMARKDFLSQIAMNNVLREVEVSEDDAKAYYEEHKAQYTDKPKANAKHILVESEDQANEIKAKINAGEVSFEDAAREYSTCPSNERGGDLGQFSPGQMVPEFEEAVFGGNIDELMGPVKTQFGHHLILVTAKTEVAEKSFEDVKDQVMQEALMDKQNETYLATAKILRDKYL